VAQELGYEPCVDEVPAQTMGTDHEDSESPSHPLCSECLSASLMRFEHTRPGCHGGWRCDACGKPSLSVIGCLSCVFVVCDACGELLPKQGKPVPGRDIADALGLSVTRVHQIERQALRRLAHPDKLPLTDAELRAFGSRRDAAMLVYGGAA
jgi:hypothetical protein